MGVPVFEGFDPELFRFLDELAEHNDRDWFQAQKARYEAQVREPALAFVRAMGVHLAAIAPRFVASDKKVGGSLMRIYRDVRFSADKSPYKTNVGIHFRHGAGKDVHAPGLYVHLESGASFLGVGIWKPDGPSLARIRERIDETPDAYLNAVEDRGFLKHWRVEGESLKRAPRGYPSDHPMLEALKLKSHTAMCALEREEITQPDFLERTAERFEAAAPYVRFLCDAVGVAYT